ncbi:MAG: DMT family transporter [Actinobacteria bacterium]|nr:DMT family transporter [Actinomycetota bacterium]
MQSAPLLARLLPMLLAIGVGVLIVTQARLNSEIVALGLAPASAALLTFGTGMTVTVVLTALVPRLRLGLGQLRRQLSAGRAGGLAWWYLLGGLGGAFFVTTQGVAGPVIGVAVFSVAVVAGQTSNSLLVDRLGLGPAGVLVVTGPRVAGALLAVVGVAVASWQQLSGGALGLVLLTVLAGGMTAWQQAVNGRVALAAGHVWIAGLVNFLVGFLVLLVVSLILTRWPDPDALRWWMPLAGLCGLSFIVLGAWVVRRLGVLLMLLFVVAGQVFGGIAITLWWPVGDGSVSVAVWCGAFLTLAAAGLAGWRRAPAPDRSHF